MKKLKLEDQHKPGDEITVQMQKPDKGKYPIGRTNNGIICLIKMGTKGFFEYNSTWTAEIVEVHEKKLIIKPLECIVTAAAEEFNLKEKLKKLGTMKPERNKVKKSFQYLSKSEQEAA